MILVIDNYDSFVHNLARYFRELGREVAVVRNDRIGPEEAASGEFEAIVLSPGPCSPEDAGVCLPLLASLGERQPLLGVCLGHQAIGMAFGGTVSEVEPIHGTASLIHHTGERLFAGLPTPFPAARYHSLAVTRVPRPLRTDARTESGLVMAVAHRTRPIFGVQFHPESILTEHGHLLLKNFLSAADVVNGDASRPSRPV